MQKILKTKICKNCGQKFETTSGAQIYCSSYCKKEYYSEKKKKN
ncbi:hypothetical protein [Methanobacterium paludis]|jgi:hypothetical protein|nr:hypothetical protein [Methanobacterium paludis]